METILDTGARIPSRAHEFDAVVPNQLYCCKLCQTTDYRKTYHTKEKIQTETSKAKKPKAKNSIADIAIKAREHGMSYGKYLAMIAAKER